MSARVLTHDTKNYTYNIGYSRTAKTTYEQRQEQRAELLYMTIQRGLGILSLVLGVISIIYIKDAEFKGAISILLLFIGLILTLTNKHALG